MKNGKLTNDDIDDIKLILEDKVGDIIAFAFDDEPYYDALNEATRKKQFDIFPLFSAIDTIIKQLRSTTQKTK
jgi:hypothetical protein